MTWQAEQLDGMQNTGIPKQVFQYRPSGKRDPERPKRDRRSLSRNKPMSEQKNSDQRKSNNKQACSAKLNQPEFGANAPLIGSVYPCREMSDLYCQVWKKNGRSMSLAGNWGSYSTAEGDNTGWQGATAGRMQEIIG